MSPDEKENQKTLELQRVKQTVKDLESHIKNLKQIDQKS